MVVFVLDRWAIAEDALEARFTQGPADAPVVYINVEGLENVPAVQAFFAGLEPFNEEVVVSESSGEVSIKGEYGGPLMLRGKQVSLRKSAYEATDFERDAKLNKEWGTSMHEAWRALNARVGDAKQLLVDQRRRLLEKAARHAADSTAHKLYEQQVSFIDRVLSKFDTQQHAARGRVRSAAPA